MAEYIERDKAIEAVRSDPMGGLNYKRILTDIPAADVAPVVRCRDCREFAKASHWCESFDNPTGEDDFCSYGERKE